MAGEFLITPSTRAIKKDIRNICDSYGHTWDILAELAQNSVDAIKQWNKQYPDKERKHFINISINQQNNSLTIEDSGIGIPVEDMPKLLAPHETLKEDDYDCIGEKGVGLTFCIFSTNCFQVDTKSGNGQYYGEVKLCRNWKDSDDFDVGVIPKVENDKISMKTIDAMSTGTKIVLSDVYSSGNDDDIFNLPIDRLQYILRTKTAIGYTGKRFSKGDVDIDVNLTLTDRDGNKTTKKVPFEYAFPDEYFDKKDVVDLEEFEKEAVSMSDDRKRKKLSGKIMKLEGIAKSSGNTLNFFAIFVPERSVWKEAGRRNNLNYKTIGDVEVTDLLDGIFVSVKGMPTSIKLDPPSTGAMGFWPHVFILIEYDKLKFDLGRKTIGNGRHKGMIKDLAADLFRKFNRWTNISMGKSPTPKNASIAEVERDAEFKKLDAIPNLGLSNINFRKQPDMQEAAVAAIFHEMIGAKILLGYCCMKSGYKRNYDFWGRYIIEKSRLGKTIRENGKIPDKIDRPAVIEFKYDASDVIDDVKSDTKHFIDIDLIVCWEINEAIFAKNGINVNPLHSDDVFWFGSNYELEWPSTHDLGAHSTKYVLSLKHLIDSMRREKQ